MQSPSLQTQAPAFRQVDAGHGTQWWGSGWQWLFNRGAAGVWIGMCLIALVILIVLHVVPMLGSMAAQVGGFVFAGGLMLAARKTDQGTAPAVGDLFAGFGPSLGPLAIGGVLIMVAVLLIWIAAGIAGIGAIAGAAYGALTGNLALLAGASATSLLVALIALIVLVPVAMASWLSPALIVLRQMPPVDALKASFSACWANLGALTVYGLLWIAFAILASIPLGLGWLILAPLTVLSTYAAYQDLFEATVAAANPSPAAAGG
jgi:uncharacterized membrane protein